MRVQDIARQLGVTSIYKGYIVLAVLPAQKMAELFISYGQAEYRNDTGRIYAAPIAEIDGDGSAIKTTRESFTIHDHLCIGRVLPIEAR